MLILNGSCFVVPVMLCHVFFVDTLVELAKWLLADIRVLSCVGMIVISHILIHHT